jgi:O-antigen ligase
MPSIIITAILVLLAILLGTITAVLNSPWIFFLITPFVFVALALRDYRIAVVTLVMLITLGQSRFLPSFSGFNVFNYLILGATVGLSLKWFLEKKPVLMPPKALLLLVVPMTLGLINGVIHVGSLPSTTVLIEGVPGVAPMEYAKLNYVRPMLYILLSVLIANAIRDSKNQDKWSTPIVISAISPAIGIMGIIIGFGLDLGSLSTNWNLLGSIGLHKNSLGGALAFGLAPLLFLTNVTKSYFGKLVLLACICLLAATLLLTFSRGGVTAAIVIWILYCYYYRQWLQLTLSILIIPIGYALLPAEIVERLALGLGEGVASFGNAGADDALSAGRFWLWENLLPEIAKRPIFGAGLVGHMWSDLALISRVSYPHNLFLSTLVDVGIPGAISVFVFYAIMIRGFYRLSKAPSISPIVRALGAAGWATMIGFLVFGLTNSDFHPGKEQTPLWVLIGVLFAYWQVAFPVPARSALIRPRYSATESAPS